MEQLGVQKTAKEDAERRAEQARDNLLQVEKRLGEKRQEYQDKSDKIQDLSAKNIFETVMSLTEVQEQIKQLDRVRNDLGLPAVITNAKDLLTAIGEAKAVTERGASVLLPLVRAPDRKKRWTWLLIAFFAAPVLGILFGWIFTNIRGEWFAQAAGVTATLAAWIATTTETLRRSGRWVSDRVAQLERVQQVINSGVVEEQNKIKVEIANLEKQRTKVIQEEQVELRKLDEAKQQVEKSEEELRQATPARLLARFIQDRVESNDYRKHLGVLALIRDDFKKLSDLIQKDNSKSDEFQKLEEEQIDEPCRINRIILYIDDLDRCQADKVIQVLQAVHLLLAFPLFVVVVAVDARWVSGALRERYGQLLGSSNQDDLQVSEETQIAATPLDYLEKIFQIPFWLSPMNVAARQRMLEGLVRNSAVITATGVTQMAGGQTTQLTHTQAESSSEGQSGKNSTPIAPEETMTVQQEQVVSTDLNPETLIIMPTELEFIKQISPLLGRSPRALKRFINIYRLIKASLSDTDRVAFAPATGSNAEFRTVMFLLAIVTHSPEISQKYFEALYEFVQAHPQTNRLNTTDWEGLFNESGTPSPISAWSQLSRWIHTNEASSIRNSSLKRIFWWARRVSRYSFLQEPGVTKWYEIEE